MTEVSLMEMAKHMSRANLSKLDALRGCLFRDVDGRLWKVSRTYVSLAGFVTAHVHMTGDNMQPYIVSLHGDVWEGAGSYHIPREVRDDMAKVVRNA